MHRAVARISLAVAYLSFAAGGVISFISPSETVESRVAWGVYGWASMFAVGGIVASYGALRRHWITERTGLYPLIVAHCVYAASLFVRYATNGDALVLFLAFLFLALVALLVARHAELTRISRASAIREVS